MNEERKWTVWHDDRWTCLLVDNAVSKSTVSLDRLEAAALRKALVPPEAPPSWDSHGDGGESQRLYDLGAGHVLSEADVRDIQNLIADHNEELGRGANVFHEGRLAALEEIGGKELVTAVTAREDAEVRRAVDRAMARHRAALSLARGDA